MLDFSFAELMVVAVGAVLFLRPADVPVVLRAVVKAVRSVRHFGEDIKRQVLDAIEEDDTIATIKQEVGGGRRFILDDSGNYREVYDVGEILELSKPRHPETQPKDLLPSDLAGEPRDKEAKNEPAAS